MPDAARPGWLIGAVLGTNRIAGSAFGWLFWRYRLEAAMLSHAAAHGIAGVIGGVAPA
jgi:hypothetical protein